MSSDWSSRSADQTESTLGCAGAQARVRLRDGGEIYGTIVEPLSGDDDVALVRPWGCTTTIGIHVRDVALASVVTEATPKRRQRIIARQRAAFDAPTRAAERWERMAR